VASSTDFRVGDVVWIGLPVFTVNGKASLRVVSVRFARYPAAGLSGPRFYWTTFRSTNSAAITLLDDKEFHRYGFGVDGPYVGAVLRPGHPVGYGVAKVIVQARGNYAVDDLIVRYAEPDGSIRAQTFHFDYVVGTNGGGPF
jgi:hypothetical protein